MGRRAVLEGDRRARRLSFLVATLVIDHGLIYALAFGTGPRLARAMSERGHDGYWTELAIAGLLTALLLLALSVVQIGRLLRLWRLARRLPGGRTLRTTPAGSVARTAGRRILVFASLLILAYLGQENLEAVAAGVPPAGLAALWETGGAWAPLVLLVSAVLLALLDTALDWSRRRLLDSIRIALARRRPLPRRPVVVGEIPPSLSLRGLRPGRAPPRALAVA